MNITQYDMLKVRPDDARIEGNDDYAFMLACVATDLSGLFERHAFDGDLDDEKLAALWCSYPEDTFGMFDDLVARVGLDEEGMRHVVQAVFELLPVEDREALRALKVWGIATGEGFEKFLAEFPQTVRDYSTGGGCMAWMIELPANRYILVTDPDDPSPPEWHMLTVGCNSYDADGQCEQGDDDKAYAAKSWAEAIEFVRTTLAAANETLFSAMVALHDELASLELDIAELGDRDPIAPHASAESMRDQHCKLAAFYDVDVYLQRTAVRS